jgi:hypothetical protein
MSLGMVLLGVFLILVGITWLGWVAVGTMFLGGFALVTGIVILVEGVRPLPLWKHQ